MAELIGTIKDPVVVAARKRLGHFRPAEATSFLAEGVNLVVQALEAQAPVEAILFLHPIQPGGDEQALGQARAAGVPCHLVTKGVFSRVLGVGYETTPRVLATVRITSLSLAELVRTGVADGLLLIGEQIQDPRNAGGLIRTADAWGVKVVAFTTGSANPHSRASVRASTGSIFHVGVSTGLAVADLVAALRKAGVGVIGTSASGEVPIWDADLSPPCAVLLGNEGAGLSQQARAASDAVVSIPVLGRAHSFNVTVAAGIVLYEAARQRARGLPTQAG